MAHDKGWAAWARVEWKELGARALGPWAKDLELWPWIFFIFFFFKMFNFNFKYYF